MRTMTEGLKPLSKMALFARRAWMSRLTSCMTDSNGEWP